MEVTSCDHDLESVTGTSTLDAKQCGRTTSVKKPLEEKHTQKGSHCLIEQVSPSPPPIQDPNVQQKSVKAVFKEELSFPVKSARRRKRGKRRKNLQTPLSPTVATSQTSEENIL